MLTFYSTLDNLSVSLWWSVVIFTKSLKFTFTSKLKTVVHVHLCLLIFTKAFLTFHVNSVTNFCAYTMSFFPFCVYRVLNFELTSTHVYSCHMSLRQGYEFICIWCWCKIARQWEDSWVIVIPLSKRFPFIQRSYTVIPQWI
jgi:hypothetical protein